MQLVGFATPANCPWCRVGADPFPGKRICANCVLTFQRKLCSARWQKERRRWLAEHPYCVGCVRNKLNAQALPPGFTVDTDSLSGIITHPIAGQCSTPLPHMLSEIAFGVCIDIPLGINIPPLAPGCLVAPLPTTDASVVSLRFPLECIGTVPVATILDHVLSWRTRPSMFYHEDNRQGLCHTCHNVKTNREDFGNRRHLPQH